MLTDITLGQYFPGTSPLHSMDARVKIVLLFIYIVAIFLFDNHINYGIMTAGAVGVVLLSRLPLGMVLKSIKPLWWIILFSFGIHLFSTPGEPIFKLWMLSMTWEGVVKGFFIGLRLVLMIMVSSMLMFTTSPLKLTDGLESLMSPLKKIGFPAHELAMMMTIAMRFIPTLLEETDKIIKAQQSRGSDIGEGNFLQRAKGMIPVLVPLFISAFRRADELAVAMEARCYQGGEDRTRMKQQRLHDVDFWAGGIFALFIISLVAVQLTLN
ncbi:energy-coupling factor transporter transmembrane protein EcfT [uncultured Anaerovibrio sp.]|uniref:energy-coupling factor transporter transmembrane component T family protein n=1 Tax=uncultured Anaerovibrio sp. TaxID=361586 RepID=UPI00262DC3D9|nr:energy-coupling factor transporter transmembrane component T [uncultured Anaerovibrio sp.]